MEEPKISIERIVSSTEITREFAKFRKESDDEALFILRNGEICSVLMSYNEYLEMYNNGL